MKICPRCKTELPQRRQNSKAIYCSTLCRQLANRDDAGRRRRAANPAPPCGICGSDLPVGRRSYCSSACSTLGTRRRILCARFGITPAEYDALILRAGGRCEACGRRPTGGTQASALHIDHDHETGVVRGWLCMQCNVTLGLVRDDIARLGKLIAYLELHAG